MGKIWGLRGKRNQGCIFSGIKDLKVLSHNALHRKQFLMNYLNKRQAIQKMILDIEM